jgi:hypothetical protein
LTLDEELPFFLVELLEAVCVCVCVCVSERKREGERERKKERERGGYVDVCVDV